jgi:hypothetical protein
MWRDTIVDETRKAREEYAARFNYDLEAIYRDLKEKEEKSEREVVSLPPRESVLLTATQGIRRQ